ncbi:MAG: PKD domain-containing protein [Thermoplasmata archaeon]|nr:PKD domain-containing protein [Thermoplasmata archaeon]
MRKIEVGLFVFMLLAATITEIFIAKADEITQWIVEDRETSHGSSSRNTINYVYDPYRNMIYLFYFDNTDMYNYTHLCIQGINLANNQRSIFRFDNSKYVAGDNWNNNQYYEAHIDVAVDIDNYEYIWLVYGGHANSNYPITFVRSKYPISSPNFKFNESTTWDDPITVDTTTDDAYEVITTTQNNTYLLFMRHGNSKMGVWWSFDNGSTWHNRDISDEFYGGSRWIKDTDGTVKLFCVPSYAKYSTSSFYNLKATRKSVFFWMTADDIINGRGARASNQTVNDTPLYSFPVTYEQIIANDILDLAFVYNNQVEYNINNHKVYLLGNGNSSSLSNTYILEKELGTTSSWVKHLVKEDDSTYTHSIRTSLRINYKNNTIGVLLFKNVTGGVVPVFSEANISDLSFNTWHNIVDTPETTYEYSHYDYLDNGNITIWELKVNNHQISTANGDVRNQNGYTTDFIALKYYQMQANNNPPVCSLSASPTSGDAPLTVTFYMSASDSDGTIASWQLDVDNDGTAEYSGSGTPPATQTHTYNDPGTYTAKLTVTDNDEATAYDIATVMVNASNNNPPNTPDQPSGPTSGYTGSSYTYSTSATDPDGDQIKYGWDWDGDGTVDEWTGYYSSGTTVSISHSWDSTGTYNIKVKAQDSNSAESGWSTALTVTISSPPPSNNPPVLSNPSPSNGATDVDLQPDVSIHVSDPDGDTMTITINLTNADGGWQQVSYSGGNGTYGIGNLNQHINTYEKTYYWTVTADDGHGGVTTATYHFTTVEEEGGGGGIITGGDNSIWMIALIAMFGVIMIAMIAFVGKR